jgi:hypothetical protein
MAWTNFHSAAYAEKLSDILQPKPDPRGPDTLVFAVPLWDTAMPLIALEELGFYGRWVFDNVEGGNAMTLKLGTGHIKSAGLVKDFAAVIGRKAVYKTWLSAVLCVWSILKLGSQSRAFCGSRRRHPVDIPAELHRILDHGEVWLVKRNYQLLDEILPGRIRTFKEWMKKTKQDVPARLSGFCRIILTTRKSRDVGAGSGWFGEDGYFRFFEVLAPRPNP